MKLAIGNDHSAVEMKKEIKKYLEDKGIEVIDVGTNSTESFNYPIKQVFYSRPKQSIFRGYLRLRCFQPLSPSA